MIWLYRMSSVMDFIPESISAGASRHTSDMKCNALGSVSPFARIRIEGMSGEFSSQSISSSCMGSCQCG